MQETPTPKAGTAKTVRKLTHDSKLTFNRSEIDAVLDHRDRLLIENQKLLLALTGLWKTCGESDSPKYPKARLTASRLIEELSNKD